jgi:hypothetical protein
MALAEGDAAMVAMSEAGRANRSLEGQQRTIEWLLLAMHDTQKRLSVIETKLRHLLEAP